MFMMINIIHYHHDDTNRQLQQQQLKRGHRLEHLGNIILSAFGQAVTGECYINALIEYRMNIFNDYYYFCY